MNLLADESVDRPIVERLRADNHSVVYVAELDPGVGDDAVLERANHGAMLLITADRDFGELVFRLRRIHADVVLIRYSLDGIVFGGEGKRRVARIRRAGRRIVVGIQRYLARKPANSSDDRRVNRAPAGVLPGVEPLKSLRVAG